MTGHVLYYLSRLQRALVNKFSAASDPAGLTVSDDKLWFLCPSLFSESIMGMIRCYFLDGFSMRYRIRDMLINGDSRAAMVICPRSLNQAYESSG